MKKLFQVNASSPQYIAAAFQHEVILNHQLNSKLNKKVKFINDFVRTAVNEGTVCIRVGWETEYQTKKKQKNLYMITIQLVLKQVQLHQYLTAIEEEQQAEGLKSTDESEIFQTLELAMQESVRKTAENGIPIIAVDTE